MSAEARRACLDAPAAPKPGTGAAAGRLRSAALPQILGASQQLRAGHDHLRLELELDDPFVANFTRHQILADEVKPGHSYQGVGTG
jgi:hypothetical protein